MNVPCSLAQAPGSPSRRHGASIPGAADAPSASDALHAGVLVRSLRVRLLLDARFGDGGRTLPGGTFASLRVASARLQGRLPSAGAGPELSGSVSGLSAWDESEFRPAMVLGGRAELPPMEISVQVSSGGAGAGAAAAAPVVVVDVRGMRVAVLAPFVAALGSWAAAAGPALQPPPARGQRAGKPAEPPARPAAAPSAPHPPQQHVQRTGVRFEITFTGSLIAAPAPPAEGRPDQCILLELPLVSLRGVAATAAGPAGSRAPPHGSHASRAAAFDAAGHRWPLDGAPSGAPSATLRVRGATLTVGPAERGAPDYTIVSQLDLLAAVSLGAAPSGEPQAVADVKIGPLAVALPPGSAAALLACAERIGAGMRPASAGGGGGGGAGGWGAEQHTHTHAHPADPVQSRRPSSGHPQLSAAAAAAAPLPGPDAVPAFLHSRIRARAQLCDASLSVGAPEAQTTISLDALCLSCEYEPPAACAAASAGDAAAAAAAAAADFAAAAAAEGSHAALALAQSRIVPEHVTVDLSLGSLRVTEAGRFGKGGPFGGDLLIFSGVDGNAGAASAAGGWPRCFAHAAGGAGGVSASGHHHGHGHGHSGSSVRGSAALASLDPPPPSRVTARWARCEAQPPPAAAPASASSGPTKPEHSAGSVVTFSGLPAQTQQEASWALTVDVALAALSASGDAAAWARVHRAVLAALELGRGGESCVTPRHAPQQDEWGDAFDGALALTPRSSQLLRHAGVGFAPEDTQGHWRGGIHAHPAGGLDPRAFSKGPQRIPPGPTPMSQIAALSGAPGGGVLGGPQHVSAVAAAAAAGGGQHGSPPFPPKSPRERPAGPSPAGPDAFAAAVGSALATAAFALSAEAPRLELCLPLYTDALSEPAVMQLATGFAVCAVRRTPGCPAARGGGAEAAAPSGYGAVSAKLTLRPVHVSLLASPWDRAHSFVSSSAADSAIHHVRI